MTTFVDFVPTATSPFTFQATLDGQQYQVLVSWNIFGQRYYVNVFALDGTRIVTIPMVGSPTQLPLAAPPSVELVTSMIWSPTNGGQVAFALAEPSVFVLGDTIDVSGAVNSGTAGDGAVNGEFVISEFVDSQHFVALLTAPFGAIGTITGTIVLNVGTYALVWDQGIVTATAAAPHDLALGDLVDLTIAGASPSGYNGQQRCAITGPSTFTYPLAVDPGVETVPGTFSSDLSLVAGYFSSTLVFRPFDQQFEIS